MIEITLFWNYFLEKGDHLLQYIGTDNECVNKLLLNARGSRVEIKTWANETLGSIETLDNTKHKTKRTKRQAAWMIGGVTSLLSFGFSEWQISRINSRITNMQYNVSHNEGNIQLLDKAVKFD